MAADETAGSGADIDVEIAGQKVNVKNVKSLNTIVTLLTFAAVSVMGYAMWNHQQDSRSATEAFVAAIKDQTAAMRESAKLQREANCYAAMQGRAHGEAELCKRIAQ